MHSTRILSILVICSFILSVLPVNPAVAHPGSRPPQPVQDINTLTSDSASIYCIFNAFGKVLLLANDGINGLNLYSSDGTPEGTTLVKVISTWERGLSCENVMLKNQLYFRVSDEGGRYDLWATDGTPQGTRLAVDFDFGFPSIFYSTPTIMVVSDGYIYLFGGLSRTYADYPYDFSPILVKTDGTQAGTEAIRSSNNRVYYGNHIFGVYGGAIYFNGGLSEATRFVMTCRPVTASGSCYPIPDDYYVYMRFLKYNQLLYYDNNELWVWDTINAPSQVTHINPKGSANVTNLVALDKWLYFQAVDATHGREWWRTDGIPGGKTEMVADLVPGSTTVQPWNLQMELPDGGLLFQRKDSATITIGVLPAGATSIDIILSVNAMDTVIPILLGDRIILNFSGQYNYKTQYNSKTLYSSDGTAAGTHMIYTAGGSMGCPFPSIFNGLEYFCGFDAQHGYELWQTDGTVEGTRMAVDLNASAAGSFPGVLTVGGDKLFFFAWPNTQNRELWSLDTHFGAQAQPVIGQFNETFGTYPAQIRPGKDSVFFYHVQPKLELWVTNGTQQGTIRLTNSIPNQLSIQKETALAEDGTLYFWKLLDNCWRLSKTNGTPETTVIVDPAKCFSVVPLHRFENTLIFMQRQASSNTCDLWISDGTVDGTQPVVTVLFDSKEYNSLSCERGEYFQANQRVFLAQPTGKLGVQLVQTDGSAAGTFHLTRDPSSPLQEIAATPTAVGDTLYFLGRTISGWGLWKTRGIDVDGLTQVLPLPMMPDWQPAYWLSASNNKLFFVISENGQNILWVSDGTSKGTRRLSANYNDPQDLIAGGPYLFFTAEDSPDSKEQHGREIWVSDGTDQGTHLLADINPGSGSSIPREPNRLGLDLQNIFAVSGMRLYFSATDGGRTPGSHGAELWVYDFASDKLYLPAIGR